MTPPTNDHCESCGVPWSEHLGIAVTCAELTKLRAAFSDEQTKRVLLASRIAAIREKIESIVETGDDHAGIVLLNHESTMHIETIDGKKYKVYDHEHFSELGDALIELWEMTR